MRFAFDERAEFVVDMLAERDHLSRLQQLATRTGQAITVCHFPPGTNKWNKSEHCLFSYVAMNWHGTRLVDLATIVSLIGSTHSRAGLHVRAELDRGH